MKGGFSHLYTVSADRLSTVVEFLQVCLDICEQEVSAGEFAGLHTVCVWNGCTQFCIVV